MNYRPIKDVILIKRKHLGLSQKALANLSGVPINVFSDINTDKITSEEIEQYAPLIASALQVELDSLLKVPVGKRLIIDGSKQNLLKEVFPEYRTKLHNPEIAIPAINKLTLNSSMVIKWKCESCAQPFNPSIKVYFKDYPKQLNGKCTKCCTPQLSNKSQPKFPDLHPDQVLEYSNKNTLPITNVGMRSSKYFHWECVECDHEWIDTVQRKITLGCPACIIIKRHKKVLDCVSHQKGKIIGANKDKTEYQLECAANHQFTLTSNDILQYEWCEKCVQNKPRKTSLKLINKNQFLAVLAKHGFTPNFSSFNKLSSLYDCICPDGHNTRIVPYKAYAADLKGKPIECYECKKAGKYRKQYYKTAKDIIDAIIRLNIISTREFRERCNEDDKLCAKQLTEFPEVKEYLYNINSK